MSMRDRYLFFGTGFASVVLVYSTIKHLKSLSSGTRMSDLIKNEPKKLEDGSMAGVGEYCNLSVITQ
jgi:hypothetical protein